MHINTLSVRETGTKLLNMKIKFGWCLTLFTPFFLFSEPFLNKILNIKQFLSGQIWFSTQGVEIKYNILDWVTNYLFGPNKFDKIIKSALCFYVSYWAYSFLNSALDNDKWSTSCVCRFTSGEKAGQYSLTKFELATEPVYTPWSREISIVPAWIELLFLGRPGPSLLSLPTELCRLHSTHVSILHIIF